MRDTATLLLELQCYLDRKVVKNLVKLLEGLILVCIPTHLDDVCEKGLVVYYSALAALTRITELAANQATPQGKTVARKILDQLQPENHKEAPGSP
jgi:ADP-ribosylglycohydrolase